MKKIWLYSKNKKNIDKIIDILDGKDLNLQVEKSFDNLPSLPEDTGIIILDITLKDGADDIHFKNSIKIADKYNITKLIILNTDQTNFLFEDDNTFDDFIFYNRFEEELFLRIKAILLKRGIFPPKNSIVVDRLILNLDKYELSINERL